MSTSRKRNKASKGKKSNSSSSSRSLAGDGGGGSNQTDMAGLQEPGGGDASGAGAGDDPWVWEKKKAAGVAKAKAPAGDRLVYFDPQIILPPADKRSGELSRVEGGGATFRSLLPVLVNLLILQRLHVFVVCSVPTMRVSFLLHVMRSGSHHRESLSSQKVNEQTVLRT